MNTFVNAKNVKSVMNFIENSTQFYSRYTMNIVNAMCAMCADFSYSGIATLVENAIWKAAEAVGIATRLGYEEFKVIKSKFESLIMDCVRA